MIFVKKGRVRLRAEHAENAGLLRVITLAMAWSSGIAIGLAIGDLAITMVLTAVITAGHLVSWRTRTWRSARWQIILLLPLSVVAVLLIPSLPQAFNGDWLHPIRYLLLLQALASFYLHSRASLYTAQTLSGIILLITSQIAFDSVFLLFFFLFFGLLLVFLGAATVSDAASGAIGRARWPGNGQRTAWSGAGLLLLFGAGLATFLLLPWGSLTGRQSESMLPLTGRVSEGGGTDQAAGPTEVMPLTGEQTDPGSLDALIEDIARLNPSSPPGAGDTVRLPDGGASETEGAGGGGGVSDSAPVSSGTLVGEGAGSPSGVPGDEASPNGVPDPIVMQIRSQVATYWRGRTYSRFDGSRWLPDELTYLEKPTRTDRSRYVQTYFLREELDAPVLGYSPLVFQPVGAQSDGQVLDAGDVYRVVSERRDFQPARLYRSPGANLINRGPDALVPQRVRELALAITAGSGHVLDRSLAITRYLRTNYTFAESSAPWEPAQSVEQFLFGQAKVGNAFDFASAQTALAVAAGLHARLVTGYLPGELDPLSGTYVVRASDAHAWTEVNFRGTAGWVPFDGNPREDGRATTASRGGAAGAIAGLFDQRFGDEVRGALAMGIEEITKTGGPALGGLGVAIMALNTLFLARRLLGGRRRRQMPYASLAGAERRQVVKAYERLMRQVRHRVEPRRPYETLDSYFQRVAQRCPELREELGWLKSMVSEAIYRPGPFDAGRAGPVLEAMRTTAKQVRAGARS